MGTFIITFGQQYPREAHPTFPAASRDGWVSVEAEDYDTAKQIADRELAGQYSTIYPQESFEESAEIYPKGKLGELPLPLAEADTAV